ncbi:DUF1344 domain-containing protein [Hyphomonas sp.]|uniref:DUF1344 domain-containing protein n=1 Tax=Hyphomonas sp. TaxID=87 RepID=UPI0025C351BF|nr:DUF1344 domain-containing protein [Hyphomonas sp.]MBI1400189.1 DUF1344 domain-containing protein [Hyphomonas sp.]
MRNYILPAALAAMMTLAPIASAAAPQTPAATQSSLRDTKAHGVIRSIGRSSLTFTLDDGRTFALPAGSTSELKTGEKVAIHWVWSGQLRLAKEVLSDY